jgi:hypothetical protein
VQSRFVEWRRDGAYVLRKQEQEEAFKTKRRNYLLVNEWESVLSMAIYKLTSTECPHPLLAKAVHFLDNNIPESINMKKPSIPSEMMVSVGYINCSAVKQQDRTKS